MSAKGKSSSYHDNPPMGASVLNESPVTFDHAPKQIGAFEAKTHLASILDQVADGKSFIVTKRGVPVAEIKPITPAVPKKRELGFWKGRISMAADFDAPLEDFKDYM